MPDLIVDLTRRSLPPDLGRLVAEARRLIGWSQRELAGRAATSQSTVSRIERGAATALDLGVVARVLDVLGMRAELHVDGRHLADRRRQTDAVHAWINGFAARRLGQWAWQPATEVRIGDERPRGWIDLLAYRPADRALVLDETKSDLPDMGALQRSLAFYEREAYAAARALGWEPRRLVTMTLLLDSAAIAHRLETNRDLVRAAFPGDARQLIDWLKDPAERPPRGWTMATCDPSTRADRWLQPTTLTRRRRPPAYSDYADAARRLLARQRARTR